MLIDTHCHVDRFPDPMGLARECENNRVLTVAVTNVPSHYEMAASHIGSMRYVKPALGFHPLAAADNMRELPLFLSLLEKAQFVGEIGLDYSREGQKSRKQQVHAFRTISEALSRTTRFVTLHSRGSAEDVVQILTEYGVGSCVFHWYSGSLSTLDRVIDAGHYLSTNIAMLASQKGRAIVQRVPRDRVLTETDGPYVKIGRDAAKPSDVKQVLSSIAVIWAVSAVDAEVQVARNYERLCASVGIANEGAAT